MTKENAFYYISKDDNLSPKFKAVEPRHAMAGDVLTMYGEALGESVVDYRMVYVGPGRPPQGGNVENGVIVTSGNQHAPCRADDFNMAANPDTGSVDSFSVPVFVEDAVIGHDSPITENQLLCQLGDFDAGSYNISAFMGTTVNTNVGGLTANYAANVSRDSHGIYYTVQYYPHVEKVTPSLGSLAGGTLLTLRGGGFSDDKDLVSVDVAGINCDVLSSTLVEITCRAGDFHKETTRSVDASVFQSEDDKENVTKWVLEGLEDALENYGFAAVGADSGVEAPGCGTPPCDPSWIVYAPKNNVSTSGVYNVSLLLPVDITVGDGASCEEGQALATNTTVLVADAVKGYVAVNVSLTTTEGGKVFLGSFTFAAGTQDGRRGAVIIDTTGATGCVVIKGVEAEWFGPTGSNCSDPLAANYDVNALGSDECIYVGGRGLLQKSWSLLAPKYRDTSSWFKDLGELHAYGSTLIDGTIQRCQAPWNKTLYEKYDTYYDDYCPATAYCCLTNDYWGCDATWDLVTQEGWVDVLRQDLQQGRHFYVDEWRRNAHQRDHENYAILDEIEEMRQLGDGRIQFWLDWPGTNYEYMHFAQKLNPQQYNYRTKSEQYIDDLVELEPWYVPYGSYDYFGGLEYNGKEALLDGSFNSDEYYFQVGAISGDSIKVSTGAVDLFALARGDELGESTSQKVRLRVRPNEFYLEPKCIDCLACYDGDGLQRGNGYKRIHNSSCPSGEPCWLNATYYEPVVSGCPARCQDMRLRSFQVNAAHQTAIVASLYQRDANCTAKNETSSCGAEIQQKTSDIALVQGDELTAQSYEGFFVAPITANYTFVVAWDTAVEVALGTSADPRSRQVILGSDVAYADGDVVGDWSFYQGHWYKVSTAELDWSTARERCGYEGGYLAQITSDGENDFVYGLASAHATTDQAYLGFSDIEHEGVWEFIQEDPREKSPVMIGVGQASEFLTAKGMYEKFSSSEPNDYNGEEDCGAMITSNGYWNDLPCTYEKNFICESNLPRGKAGPFVFQAGDVRYFEMLHVHDSIYAGNGVGATLALSLDLENATHQWSTFVSGSPSLSMEFFRQQATEPTVSVQVASLASACMGECGFVYSEDATPTVTRVEPIQGRAGQLITITGTKFPVSAGEVQVGIGGATCEVSYVNVTAIQCVLKQDEAQAGTYPVKVRVLDLGDALNWKSLTNQVNYTIDLVIDDFLPRNGSVYGGTVVQIWGQGFSRFGPQQKVTIGNDINCVPRTTKNKACRVSAYDSGYKCAWTVDAAYGYDMVESAYASSIQRSHSEWFDFSNTTYIECVVDEFVQAQNSSFPLTVSLMQEKDLVDDDAVIQKYTEERSKELDYATRNLDCFVLLGYRLFNVGLSLTVDDDNVSSIEPKNCVLWDEDYEQAGLFGDGYLYNGSSVTTSGNYTFSLDATPMITKMDTTGMAGQVMTITGTGFDAGIDQWNFYWYMDEFGFYTQPESPIIFIGSSPTVITEANATHISLIPTYNVPEQNHEVQIWVLGKGRAGGNFSFAYVNYLYEVSPNTGSIQGGTELTLTGSGWAVTYTFYASNGESMGASLADYDVTSSAEIKI